MVDTKYYVSDHWSQFKLILTFTNLNFVYITNSSYINSDSLYDFIYSFEYHWNEYVLYYGLPMAVSRNSELFRQFKKKILLFSRIWKCWSFCYYVNNGNRHKRAVESARESSWHFFLPFISAPISFLKVQRNMF